MKKHAWDLVCLAGAAAVTAGLWLAWPPGALMFAGAAMLAVGVLASVREELGKKPKEDGGGA